MRYLFGSIFLLFGIGQLVVTWRTFTNLRKNGDESTSPFIMLALWSSFVFSIIFFIVGIGCFFVDI